MTVHSSIVSSDQIAVTNAVRHVRVASAHLLEARFRLDEAGFRCAGLDELTHDASVLVAVWAGRAAPVPEIVPDYIVESAREWRRQAGRGY